MVVPDQIRAGFRSFETSCFDTIPAVIRPNRFSTSYDRRSRLRGSFHGFQDVFDRCKSGPPFNIDTR